MMKRWLVLLLTLLLVGCQATEFGKPMTFTREAREGASTAPESIPSDSEPSASEDPAVPVPSEEVEAVDKTEPEETETEPEPTNPPAPLEAGLQADSVYTALSNEDIGWWFQKGPPSTVEPRSGQLIEGHQVYWRLDEEKPVIYLTFDQGYEYNDNTSKALATLKEKDAKAMFFVVGSYVDRNPELIEQIIADGHQLGNHSVDHLRPAKALDVSIERFVRDVVDLQKKVPEMTMFYRPPEGGYSPRALQILDDLGYTTVFWSFAYKDWLTDDQPDPVWAKQYLLDNLFNGSIILLHTVSDTNMEILGDLIDGIRAAGYRIEPLPVA